MEIQEERTNVDFKSHHSTHYSSSPSSGSFSLTGSQYLHPDFSAYVPPPLPPKYQHKSKPYKVVSENLHLYSPKTIELLPGV
ncbi:hypothetical protein AYI69_g3491 [Smittium culicis]|uniref:Uncharacterized protein n=1 Tax=Smittium culicis TaxID=133412 RepID=A0A1R1YJJ2_9FUNG|nr:hypothetical protein AYI69_g3491 [Smittium culicis]